MGHFLEIVKSSELLQLSLGDTGVAGYVREGCHCGACHCTSDGQEHKLIQLAGPKWDAILILHATACMGQHRCCRQLHGGGGGNL